MSAVGNICKSWRVFSNASAFFSRKIKQSHFVRGCVSFVAFCPVALCPGFIISVFSSVLCTCLCCIWTHAVTLYSGLESLFSWLGLALELSKLDYFTEKYVKIRLSITLWNIASAPPATIRQWDGRHRLTNVSVVSLGTKLIDRLITYRPRWINYGNG